MSLAGINEKTRVLNITDAPNKVDSRTKKGKA